jgi:putative heme iron utilization protein
MTDPVRPTDHEARTLACALLRNARHGALGVIDPSSGGPMVTRVAVGWDGVDPLILISSLASHTAALLKDPRTSLLIGEPGERGDPLTHPRLTLMTTAHVADKAQGRAGWLRDHPKSTLYFDFTDFMLIRLSVTGAHLNGGFGKAYRLVPSDLSGP